MEAVRETLIVLGMLRRLTRRPMRAWWGSVGLPVASVMLLLTALKIALELPASERLLLLGLDLPNAYGVGATLKSGLLPCAVILLALMLWFLAALNLKLIFSSALQDLPLESTPEAARAAYFLLLAQGLLPCLAIFVVSLPFGNYLLWDVVLHPDGVWYSSTANEIAHSCAAIALGMTWVMLLLCALRTRHWLVAAVWLIVMLVLPVAISLFNAMRGFGSVYVDPAAPLSWGPGTGHGWMLSFLLAATLAVLMIRRFAIGRAAAGNALLGLLLAGGALSALDKYAFSTVYDSFGGAEIAGADVAGTVTDLLLDLGHFPMQVPLYQFWTPDERLVALHIPLNMPPRSVSYEWRGPLLLNLLWVPIQAMVLLLSVPALINRRTYVPHFRLSAGRRQRTREPEALSV